MVRKLWQKWKAFGELIGNLFARLILSVFYFTVLVPFALIAQFFTDPLVVKTPPESFWQLRKQPGDHFDEARRQA